jgi:predicted DNA-binding transcriptional regulator YafY
VWIRYRDKDGGSSERTIWPITIGFMERVNVLAAWCELRQGFRHFRLDQVETARVTDERFARPRSSFMGEWRAREAVDARW